MNIMSLTRNKLELSGEVCLQQTGAVWWNFGHKKTNVVGLQGAGINISNVIT